MDVCENRQMGVTMISYKIKNVKHFMGKFLTTESFDSFLVEEASVSTYNTFLIDGRQNKAFYTTEEWEDKEIRPYEFTEWKKLRPVCYSLIKGRRTPCAFKFVLHLIPDYVPSILKDGDTGITPQQIKAFVLTIKYDETGLTLVTGTSFHTFLRDNSADELWDKAMGRFLDKREIEYD